MVRGLYTAASGALVAESMADNVANNLANVNTGGFKKTLLQIQSAPSLDIYRIQTDPGKVAGNPLPGKPVAQEVGLLGTGSSIYDTPTSFDQGPLQSTGNPFDVAITNDPNAFFTIQTANGVRYTRDGEFAEDGQGILRTRDGNPVLDTNGQQIQLPSTGGTVQIASDGSITQSGAVVAQLGLTQFNSLLNLRPEGVNNFAISGNAGPTPVTTASVQQGFLEQSNTNVVTSMVDLISAERWFEANEKSIKTEDDAVNQAITMVGKTS
ncbi:MAG TPA: flagellar hook-basal body protein [Candidatus Acidoferrales bacterium]|nr:flagellar hook-basal body protein [Candidatus Acidoferrales bacterium]